MKRDNFMILILFLFPLSVFCQVSDQQMEKMMLDEFDSLANGGYKVNNYIFNSLNERYFLDFLNRKVQEPSQKVRFRICILKVKIAMQSKDSLLRQEVVSDLTNNVSGSDQHLNQYSLSRLPDFQESDFSDKARRNLVGLFSSYHDDTNFLLTCGVAQVKSLIPNLQAMASNFNRERDDCFKTPEWYATVVLARIKKPILIDTVIAAVELELSSVFRVTRLLQLVAYTKHPDAIRLLNKYLESTEMLPSVTDPIPGTKFNQYAMEYLATYLDNFPVKVKRLNYTKDDIALGLAYLNKIKTK